MKRSPIKRKGQTATLWEIFRNKYAEECRGDDGLIECRDGERLESPDLHHVISKSQRPDLCFNKHNLVWLSRIKHQEIHNTPRGNEKIWDRLHSAKEESR